MSYVIIIEDKATEDITEARKWYSQKSDLAAFNLETEIRQNIDSLKNSIIEHREVKKGVKLLPLKIFPYNIYYRKSEATETIQIIAVLHNKRDQNFILKR